MAVNRLGLFYLFYTFYHKQEILNSNLFTPIIYDLVSYAPDKKGLRKALEFTLY